MSMKQKDNDNFLNSVYALLTNIDTPKLKDLIIKKCDELGISQRKLSEVIGLERKSIQRIMEDEAQKIDVVTFLKISHFLKIEVQSLMQIYVSKMNPENIKEIEKTKKASFILHNFDLNVLKKEGFIKDRNNFEEIEDRIIKYFRISSIYEYTNYAQAAYFSRTKRNYSDKMLNFWISLVYHQISKIQNPNDFDRELLISILPKIRGLSRDEKNGLQRVSMGLFDAGITIIVQSYIKKTQIRGATFIYGGKPYIVLTNYNKRYDSIWFALAHELYHVLKDFDQIEKLSYHLTGESDLFIDNLAEENANEFARDIFFPRPKMKYIKDFIDIPEYVENYAKQNNVHRSIIYGFYLFENREEHKKYQRYLNNSEEAVRKMIINPWDKKDVVEITENIMQLFKDIKYD